MNTTDMTDKRLSEHLDGFIAAMNERLPRSQMLKERSEHLNQPQYENHADRETRIGEYLEMFDEILSPIYRTIDLHASAILKLTTDENITGPVRRCARMASREIRDARDVYAEAQYAEDGADAWMVLVKFVGGVVRVGSQQSQMAAELAKLIAYLNAA